MSPANRSFTRNLLLSSLDSDDLEPIQPHLERVRLELNAPLYDRDAPIAYVYFPESVVASVVSTQSDSEAIEIGLFGYEGMSGAPVLLGAGQTPHRAMIQIDGGTALRIESGRLLDACAAREGLRDLLLRFVQTFSVQAAQTAASHAHYDLPARLARWLLMCHDRVEGDTIALTHEYMAMMLAVRRAGVTVTLHLIEGSGAIRSRRGVVLVTDRRRLEEIASDAYGVAEAEYRRLIGPFGKSPGLIGAPAVIG